MEIIKRTFFQIQRKGRQFRKGEIVTDTPLIQHLLGSQSPSSRYPLPSRAHSPSRYSNNGPSGGGGGSGSFPVSARYRPGHHLSPHHHQLYGLHGLGGGGGRGDMGPPYLDILEIPTRHFAQQITAMDNVSVFLFFWKATRQWNTLPKLFLVDMTGALLVYRRIFTRPPKVIQVL